MVCITIVHIGDPGHTPISSIRRQRTPAAREGIRRAPVVMPGGVGWEGVHLALLSQYIPSRGPPIRGAASSPGEEELQGQCGT